MINNETRGIAWGLLGVIAFGLTLPVTRVVVTYFDPVFLALARSSVAGLTAAILLWLTSAPRPSATQIKKLVIVALGVVVGFPILATIAMQSVPASHGGVILGILPIATAIFSTFISHERPGMSFWLSAAVGGTLVAIYSLQKGDNTFHWGDIMLFFAVFSAAIGYAVGGQLSKELNGWQVICWSLVIALPFILPAAVLNLPKTFWQDGMAIWTDITTIVWSGFFYLAWVSQLIGFFWWNKGLALGGVARVSQTMLLMPVVTIIASLIILGEELTVRTVLFAVLIIATVAFNKKTVIHQKT